ncbi:MAG: putative glycoside hydrolase [Granulicatella sp.]
MKTFVKITRILFISMFVLFLHSARAEEEVTQKLTLRTSSLLKVPVNFPTSSTYDSGINIPYPKEGVKGIYVQAFRAKGTELDKIIQYVDKTDINAVVVDVRDGYGKITMPLETDNQLIKSNTVNEITDTKQLLKTLEKHQIYPIARIVSFGDHLVPYQNPELTFRTQAGTVWNNNEGEAFLNPFLKENWEYIAEIAVGAAKAGFKDIQLDYVRFPLGFELVEKYLDYDLGDFSHYTDMDEARIAAITEFVEFVRERLKPYDVHLSADIIAHAITSKKIGGIGQKFTNIADHVDVISPMIFPSHWVKGIFGVKDPDKQPYDIVTEYMKIENSYVKELNPSPTSRPWIQAFTADFLGEGNFQLYTAKVISQEIKALKEAGIKEYLLWNAASQYSTEIDF